MPKWQTTGRIMVVGLGNPGPRYEATRHNVGFMLADALATEAGAPLTRTKFNAHIGNGQLWGRPVTILEPQTFMNLSGDAVAQALIFYSHAPSQTVLLHDDLDLPLGSIKVKVGGGHGGHNGLRSIFAETGSRDYVRVRIGIGRPASGSVTDHVLGRFQADEADDLDEGIDLGMSALRWIFEHGPNAAMNAVNGIRKETSTSAPDDPSQGPG